MKLINSIKEINHYQYYIFDIWGVIHDGINAYPEASEAVKYLKSLNKKICFLSNAPRRNFIVEDVLEKFNIKRQYYDFVMTSGEALFNYMKNNQEQDFSKFKKDYYYIGPKKDIDLLSGLDYNISTDFEKCNFALVTGFPTDPGNINDVIPVLENCKERNLTLLCANPDLKVVRQDGSEMNCAGLIGKTYQEMGCNVEYFGKPYSYVYKITCNLLNNNEKNNIIAIGDAIETDIIGAKLNNIDSLLLTGGLLSNDLNIKYWQNPDMLQLSNICNIHKVEPNYVISNLKI